MTDWWTLHIGIVSDLLKGADENYNHVPACIAAKLSANLMLGIAKLAYGESKDEEVLEISNKINEISIEFTSITNQNLANFDAERANISLIDLMTLGYQLLFKVRAKQAVVIRSCVSLLSGALRSMPSADPKL